MGETALFTIGYEGRTARDVIELLREAAVSRLVDIRAVPMSRKPEFRKNVFAAILLRSGIAYSGMPELGTPRAIRDRLAEDRDYAAFFRSFRRHLKRQDEPMFDLAALARREPIALMCFERDALKCHRSAVADELSKLVGAATLHLGAPVPVASAR